MFSPKVVLPPPSPHSRLLISSLRLQLDKQAHRLKPIERESVDSSKWKQEQQRQRQSQICNLRRGRNYRERNQQGNINTPKSIYLHKSCHLGIFGQIDGKYFKSNAHKGLQQSSTDRQKGLFQTSNPKWQHLQLFYYKDAKKRNKTIDDAEKKVTLLPCYNAKQQEIIALQKKYLSESLEAEPSNDILSAVGRIIGEGLARVKTEQKGINQNEVKLRKKVFKERKEKWVDKISKRKSGFDSTLIKNKLICPWESRQPTVLELYPL